MITAACINLIRAAVYFWPIMSSTKRVGAVSVWVILCLLVSMVKSVAQTDVSQVSVSAERLTQHVYALASKEFAGRQVGTPGQLLATN